ncbi:glycolipid-anchored surface protein 5 precursor [Scheffersomyces coipomensis]|uniref:glycolipid-anchored surface protein 5 precursor n=1 Tax=Scheffersomyces coipomensis TaxID=1788519 RepID=UPI00315D3656
MKSFLSLSLLVLSQIAISLAISPITVKGNAFFDDDGNRFYIRGVDYQPGGSSNLVDPLADSTICERDVAYFTELGINTVRVYSVDNTADHDDCMNTLANAGIYVVLDVNTPYASIASESAACSYNTDYIQQVLASVAKFAVYNNTLGYWAGNEVIHDAGSVSAAPYVKAVVRDMKTFLQNRKFRQIPVGYSAAAIDEYKVPTAEYFNCGDDDLARVDMFGFNDYSWCGDASISTSGYQQDLEGFNNYSIPLFFSEFGCNTVSPRPFTEVEAIYSTQMSSVFSGGLVYEYSQEVSNYGLVTINSDTSVTPNQDFTNLKNQFGNVTDPSGDGGYKSNLTYASCPGSSSIWNATTNIPDTPKGALIYIDGFVNPVGQGFNATTQWACADPDDNVDTTGNYTSTLGSPAVFSGSGSSTSTSSSSSSSSTSTKKSEADNLIPSHYVNKVNYLGFFAVLVGFALI